MDKKAAMKRIAELTKSESWQEDKALCQMMLVKRNLRIIGDQVDQFLLIFFS